MRSPLVFALGAVLAAAMFPASTAQFGSDPVIRGSATPNVSFKAADGTLRQGLRCGVQARSPGQRDLLERQLRQFRAKVPLQSAAGPITVPVWFHIVTKTGKGRSGGTLGNVTDAQIQDQLQVLNDAYAGRGFSFTHGGTKRVNNSKWFDGCANSRTESLMKASLAVDPAHNLNIYSCEPGSLLGFAYYPDSFPETDTRHGVVVLHSSFPGGAAVPYDEGDTATHEVGHYLGLAHTFEGGCSAPGDMVADTPPEASPAFGCPVGRDTCVGGGLDPILNFMDYTDDACMIEFTTDQSVRMQDMTALYRPSLGH